MDEVRTKLRWQSAAATHVGNVREVNEDAYLDRPEIGLWLVADGMGGHQAGDVASRMIVESFDDIPRTRDREEFLEAILDRLQAVNGELLRYAEENGAGVVGSTVALLFGFGSQANCLWAGDSRIYLLRDGQLRQLTRDHSKVEELISLGLVDREDADTHPVGNVITRAVGAAESLAVDIVSHESQVGDRFMLCSDGLNKTMSDAEIADILQHYGCAEAPKALLYRALDSGARDNVTAIVVHIEGDEDAEPNFN